MRGCDRTGRTLAEIALKPIRQYVLWLAGGIPANRENPKSPLGKAMFCLLHLVQSYIVGRGHPRDGLELPVKIGDIAKTRLIANRRYVFRILYQQFTGIAYADLVQISGKRLPVGTLEKPAKRGGVHMHHLGHLAGVDRHFEVLEHKGIDLIEVLVGGAVERTHITRT